MQILVNWGQTFCFPWISLTFPKKKLKIFGETLNSIFQRWITFLLCFGRFSLFLVALGDILSIWDDLVCFNITSIVLEFHNTCRYILYEWISSSQKNISWTEILSPTYLLLPSGFIRAAGASLQSTLFKPERICYFVIQRHSGVKCERKRVPRAKIKYTQQHTRRRPRSSHTRIHTMQECLRAFESLLNRRERERERAWSNSHLAHRHDVSVFIFLRGGAEFFILIYKGF